MEENRLRDGDRSHVEGWQALVAFSDTDEGGSGTRAALEAPSRRIASHPQHICVITETYAPEINGVAATLGNLVKGLRDRGHVVSVVHPTPRNHRTSEASERGGYSEAILVRGLPLPGYHGLQFGVPAGRRLRQSWINRPPAVVYVATEGPLGWSAVRAARSLNIPTVSGFHTNFHHYCKHYGVAWLQNLALRYLRWFHNQTDCTLVSNGDLRSRLQGAGFDDVSVMDRGVDNQLFDPQRRSTELRREWGISDDDLALIYVGRVAAEKNLELAIEAYKAISRIIGRTRFVIVGDGPLRGALQREHPELIFAGMRTGEQLARYYASADLFLFPSETETFGNVTLEAMASGLVVIGYNYACAKLHITDAETGVLVRFGDAKAFVDAACSLVRRPEDIERMRRQARQYVTCLSWPRVVETFETLLMSAGRHGRTASPSSLTRRGLAT
ncbi:MAG: glycosyltransferase family 1 protein [Candidatus Binatus sp.]